MADVGKMKHRIIIQRFVTTTSANGFDEEKWVDYKPVWAKKNNLFGKEFWAAKAIQSEKTVEFEVRYSKDLELLTEKNGTESYRILYKDRPFNIIYADNVREENRWLKIKAVEV
ncbi:phage head closure protein [Clostridium peptidivorans]|uniref:phage head closure protein n=1 Tax=Clostridium peptidivorans TaxID=100174 RepID=UPI000BE3D041|nr:phage head closure protein [Clostridium peptidivorans]